MFLPLVVSPIAFMTFDHTIMIHRIGSYVHGSLRPAIVSWLSSHQDRDDAVLLWDPMRTDAPQESVTFIKYFFFLLGNWFFFVLLVPLPTAVVTFTAGWWRWPYPSVLILDWILTGAFVYASIAVWNERAAWLGLRAVRAPTGEWVVRSGRALKRIGRTRLR